MGRWGISMLLEDAAFSFCCQTWELFPDGSSPEMKCQLKSSLLTFLLPWSDHTVADLICCLSAGSLQLPLQSTESFIHLNSRHLHFPTVSWHWCLCSTTSTRLPQKYHTGQVCIVVQGSGAERPRWMALQEAPALLEFIPIYMLS